MTTTDEREALTLLIVNGCADPDPRHHVRHTDQVASLEWRAKAFAIADSIRAAGYLKLEEVGAIRALQAAEFARVIAERDAVLRKADTVACPECDGYGGTMHRSSAEDDEGSPEPCQLCSTTGRIDAGRVKEIMQANLALTNRTNEAAQHGRQEASWRDECMRLRAEVRDIAYMAVPGSGWSRDAVEKAARAAIASTSTGPADIVELHAETLIAVAAWCASEGSDDIAAAAAEVRAFVAAANGEPHYVGPDDPADLNPEPMNAPQQDSVRNENGSHR